MRNTVSIFFVFVATFFIDSCKEQEPYIITCTDGQVKTEKLGSFNATLQNLGYDPEDRANYGRPINLVINSEPEYLHYFKAEGNYAPVDFDKQTLLFIRRGDKIAYRVTQTLIADCENNEIKWIQDATKEIGGTFDEFTPYGIGLLIPKVKDNTKLVFSVNYVE